MNMSSLPRQSTDFTGSFVDRTGAVHILQQVGSTVTVTSDTMQAYGTVSEKVLSMHGMTGELEGRCIFWSDGNAWVPQNEPTPVSVYVQPAKLFKPHTEECFNGIWVNEVGDLWQRLHRVFTLFCAVVFAPSVCLLMYVTADTNVAFWVTSDASWLWFLLVPAAVIIAHFAHWFLQPLNKAIVILVIIGIPIGLLLCGALYYSSTSSTVTELSIPRCYYPDMEWLQISWDQAYRFYTSCTENETMLITECPDYNTYLALFSHWEYLGHVETEFLCSGWCYYGEPMWTSATTKDSCSSVVYMDMRYKVKPIVLQVILSSFILLVFVWSIARRMEMWLYSHGFSW